MSSKNLMEKMLNNCDLLFEGELISKERLIQAYAYYLSETFDEKDHNVGMILHTGSICFDVMSVAAAAMSTIILNEYDVDDVINSLEINDIILYKKQRYKFAGYADNDFNNVDKTDGTKNIEYVLLKKTKTDKTFVPLKKKYRIEPYYGESKRMDGRGIRKDNNKRLNFISKLLDIPLDEVPSVINTSSIIVMSRELADRILNGLVIRYNSGKHLKILDIVTASYFSENDEYPYGGNPGKTEPILKITNKVSIARDLLFENMGNRTTGLTILGFDSVSRGRTELPELMNRRSLKYIYVSQHIDSENGDSIIKQYENASLFACTRDFLLSNSLPVLNSNPYTVEIGEQVENIINRQVRSIEVASDITWEEYREFKKALFIMRKSDVEGEDKNHFIIQSYSLLNLFLTAIFPINYMEDLILTGTLAIESPKKKLKGLYKIADSFSGTIRDHAEYVLALLEILYNRTADRCDKHTALKEYLFENKNKRIAVIVPKAYYIDILNSKNIGYCMFSQENLIISTANRFDNIMSYDSIIIVGDFKGKRFDAFKSTSSADINVLIYQFESNIFNFKMNQSIKLEAFLNQKSRISLEYDEGTYGELFFDEMPVRHEEINEIASISIDLEHYINQLNEIEARTIFNQIINEKVVSTANVSKIGTFSEGEKVFFTKDYKAFVYDGPNENVKEINIDELVPGDTLIFTMNDSFTKNIVDNIFDNLLDSGELNKEIKEAAFEAEYWKLVLEEYMEENNLSYKEVSEKLLEYGCKKHEVTIRSWLEKEYHVVGPNDKEAFIQIANMTGDTHMLSDPLRYHEACRIIRQKRTEILKLLGYSIINKLKGQAPENDTLLKAVYENVEKLAMLLQLEMISNVEETLTAPINMVNKPIAM